MVYLGSLTNFDLIYAWSQDKCVPLVREITFENGEVQAPPLHTFSSPSQLLQLCSFPPVFRFTFFVCVGRPAVH